MQSTVLITGITGFLGCHIGQFLCNENYKVIAIKRKKSDLKNCADFLDKIIWIDVDKSDWKANVLSHNPQVIIHSAWIGVEAAERNDWQLQSENLGFLNDLLEIALEAKANKFIGLGSQAEYGYINHCVTESEYLNPTSAYGAVKIIASQIIRKFCLLNSIQWYWLRVFSVFGEKEADKWLIPSVIKKIYEGSVTNMDFSAGEQQYAYLYVKDFARAVEKVVATSNDNSGIYNISSLKPEKLKTIITYIRDSLNPAFNLDFGALPYRDNQSMLIAGDSTKFVEIFDKFENTSLTEGLVKSIKFYTS